jgi:sensor histidine kinase YesM
VKTKHYSIRDRLFYSFFLTATLMCIMMLYSFLGINSIAATITNAYRTNVKLNEFQNALRLVEASLENYVSLKTFESIESYYSWRGKLDNLSVEFNVTLSAEPIMLAEYKVKRIMESFLEYADKAVYARRGNDVQEYSRQYAAALRAYRYLADASAELNALYFQRNIAGYNRVFADLQLIELLFMLILAAVIGIDYLMVYILIDKITGPLVDLSRAAMELADGNFDIGTLDVGAQDEVGAICRAFDRMTVSIRESIDTIRTKAAIENKLRQQELEMRELYKDAQLKTLQAQINPHFLFNTLNAGAQLAMMEGADGTCEFIEKTADFFRYNIQNMDKDALLSEEIELVDNYMYIMKVRFADRVSFVKDIRSADLALPMPSMILQPLVENSIKHGIHDKKSGGAISLRVYDGEGGVIVEIADNGVGISAETRARLLSGEAPADEATPAAVGIGMTNVISRLRLYFGDEGRGDVPPIFDIRRNDPAPGTTFVLWIRRV